MSKTWIIIISIFAVLFIIIGIPVLVGISTYNRLTTLDESVNNSWANVDTVLQRRYDLIPNLINTVKGYASHEKELLEEVTRLRSQWSNAQTVSEKANVASMMEGALGRLMVVVEKYPDLKANQNFLALQDELAGTENRISVERRRYNEAVKVYNTTVRRFPAVFYARLLGFERKTPFKAAEAAKTVPKVEF